MILNENDFNNMIVHLGKKFSITYVFTRVYFNQAEIIEAYKSTSRYLDDLLNIDNPYFEGMVNRIYPPELQLNKANTSDTKAHFWICIYLHVFQTDLLNLKLMISTMTLILI